MHLVSDRVFHPPQTPKPNTPPFPQPHKIRQASIAAEIYGEGQLLMLFEGEPSGAVDAGDGQFELMLGVPADAFGEGQEVAREQLFEVLDAFQFRL